MQATANRYINSIDFLNLFSWDVKAYLNKSNQFNPSYPFVLFGEFLKKPSIEKVKIDDEKEYKILGVRSYGKGVFANRTVKGKTLKMREYQKAKSNHLFWCKVDTKNGAFGVIKEDLADGVASSNMTFTEIDISKINVDFLQLLFTCKGVMQYLDSFVTGTTNRKYIRPEQLLNEIKIPLPTLKEQDALVKDYHSKINEAESLIKKSKHLESEIEKFLYEGLGLFKQEVKHKKNINLQFINFESVLEWGLDKILSVSNKKSSKYSLTSIEENPQLAINLFRGKSPKYKDGTSSIILNQKCNRWNEIDLSFVKSVDEAWLKSVDINNLTKEGDILINSTGEGTIGRASYVKKEFEGLLYDSHLLLLRLDSKKINPELFVEIFNSKYGQDQVNDIKSAQATKQTELGTSNLARIKFPILDNIIIQNEIISKIKKLRIQKLDYLNKTINLRAKAEQEFEKAIFS